ncbi:MAG: RIP metalloprotease RseP [Gemmatimonadales bacterium]
MLTTLLAFFIVLGVLIFVHELGHFLAAKAVDIAVLRFSLGLGPPTKLSFKRGETEYCVSWIPFGGYVKMAGFEEEGAAGALEGPRDTAGVSPERTFDHKPMWARLVVMAAGVTMNVLFAILVYSGLTMAYGTAVDPSVTVGEVHANRLPAGAEALRDLMPGDRIVRISGDTVTGWQDVMMQLLLADAPLRITVAGRTEPISVNVPLKDQAGRGRLVEAIVPQHEPVVRELVPGYPASAAGIRMGDRIVRIGADTVATWEQLVSLMEKADGDSVAIGVLREGRVITVRLVPRLVTMELDSGKTRQVPKIGIGYRELKRYGVVASLGEGVRRSWESATQVWFTMRRIVTGKLPASEIGGPILVGQLSGEAARMGADVFLGFMALFSINLAILNLLPIPVLDGGNIVLLVIEAVRRRPVSLEIRQRVTTIGLLLLILLMLFATYNDVGRVLKKLF